MKKIVLFFSLLLAVAAGAQNTMNNPLTLGAFEESLSDAGMKNLGTLFETNWPKDAKTGKDCAWVRVRYVNMTEKDLAALNFKGIDVVRREANKNEQTLTLFVAPVEAKGSYLEVSHPSIGLSNRLHDFTLKPKAIYYITLRREASTTITIDVKPSNVVCILDGTKRADGNGNIADVSLGKHHLQLQLNGVTVKEDDIDVTEDNIRFDYDVRKKRTITFDSDPADCDLLLDGEIVGRTPMSINLPYGSYHIEARVSAKEKDEKDITVDGASAANVKLSPIPRKRLTFSAKYNGQKVNAGLSIDGKKEPETQLAYTKDLVVGKRYKITMDYKNASTTHNVKVRKKMSSNMEYTISANNTFLWPWERYFDDAPWGFTAGYVSKQWVSRGGGHIYRGNAAWGPFGQCDPENERLHGIQLGWQYNPCYEFGLGLHTGLFAEIYSSSTKEEIRSINYNTSFNELSLYVPAHLLYRFPLGDETALYLHGGLGLDFGLLGFYSNSDGWVSNRYNNFYGKDGFPGRFNLSSEIGFGVRHKRLMLDFQYSKGITNHEDTRFTYFDKNGVGETKTKQNKLSLGLSYMYGGDYRRTRWVWEQLDEAYPWGVSVAYVSKQWVAKSGDRTYKGNAVWGQFADQDVEDCRLHGIQIGVDYNPLFERGWGFYTGCFFEIYGSFTDEPVTFSQYSYTEYDSFFSMDMYIPAHLSFWLPLGDESAIQLRGGLGFDLGLLGEFSEMSSSSSDYSSSSTSSSTGYTDYYGCDGFPNAFNVSAEIALDVRIRNVSVFTQLSMGLNNHDSVKFLDFGSGDHVKVSQNKFTFGAAYNF